VKKERKKRVFEKRPNNPRIFFSGCRRGVVLVVFSASRSKSSFGFKVVFFSAPPKKNGAGKQSRPLKKKRHKGVFFRPAPQGRAGKRGGRGDAKSSKHQAEAEARGRQRQNVVQHIEAAFGRQRDKFRKNQKGACAHRKTSEKQRTRQAEESPTPAPISRGGGTANRKKK